MPTFSGGGSGGVTPPVALTGNSDTLAAPILKIHDDATLGNAALAVENVSSINVFTVETSNDANQNDLVAITAPMSVSTRYVNLPIMTINATNGGQVRFTEAGTSVGVIITSLPTLDPHVVGQLYNLAGVVHVSAG